MDIFQLARKLGEEILETDSAKKLANARFRFDNDEAAQKIFFEYSDHRQRVQAAMEDGSLTKEDFEKEANLLKQEGSALKENEVVGAMLRAENEFNFMVNQVFDVLKYTITGEDENHGSCSGSCSTCGGCH